VQPIKVPVESGPDFPEEQVEVVQVFRRLLDEKVSAVRVGQALEQSLNRRMDVRVQQDEAEVAAQMLQQRFHTAQLVRFAGHAQTETLESTFHILEKLSKTKLAVQAWLDGGKIPY